ncbi:hypothetical protein A1Q2_07150 [Trichosporon asahii var. asahii CBS 8904]|uniref:Uncharacterized protein n=2 Tax=Trichosporon asahii var. asahii TaxID=189963 RepID=K1V3M9_TRIAC|nr:hypothetical protein A1Q1_07768 [Trichosporon asahii var. asahii CBS 2479]EJT51033.1 hypothetical protein A1Q1_07768 [Trichosporon asahii var. asahii CBS 2479]EKC98554.1 hypothetical protein A1Q2_07150 [Trichosporon asahii var. asahii CBS 8904]
MQCPIFGLDLIKRLNCLNRLLRLKDTQARNSNSSKPNIFDYAIIRRTSPPTTSPATPSGSGTPPSSSRSTTPYQTERRTRQSAERHASDPHGTRHTPQTSAYRSVTHKYCGRSAHPAAKHSHLPEWRTSGNLFQPPKISLRDIKWNTASVPSLHRTTNASISEHQPLPQSTQLGLGLQGQQRLLRVHINSSTDIDQSTPQVQSVVLDSHPSDPSTLLTLELATLEAHANTPLAAHNHGPHHALHSRRPQHRAAGTPAADTQDARDGPEPAPRAVGRAEGDSRQELDIASPSAVARRDRKASSGRMGRMAGPTVPIT